MPGTAVGTSRPWGVSVGAVALAALICGAAPTAAQQTAREIVDQVDRLLRGRSSRGVMEMEVVTEHWTRRLELEMWSLGTEYALVRVLSPQRERGVATLKAGDEIWNYLPRVDRTIKIPASLMMSSWMGSHFTNDDLVKESRMIEDYDIEIAFEGERDGEAVWEFELTPKPEAAVVWGMVVERVRKRDLMPVWVRYYDDAGALARTLTFKEYRVMGGRLVPSVTIVHPTDKPDERTTLRYEELTFNIDITEEFFSLRRLRQTGP